MNPPDAQQRIEEQAADWLGRYDGGLTPAEQADLERWLLADLRHAEAFQRLEECSRALDRLAVLRPARSRLAVASHQATARGTARRTLRPAWVLAAAAAIIVAATLAWRPMAPSPFEQVAQTRIGEAQRLTLPDGSVIALNTNSEVAIHYQADVRAIELRRGEAHFTVVKDPRRPFVVQTGAVAVRAVGTAFNVQRLEGRIEVVVTSGRVEVQDHPRGDAGTARPAPAAPLLEAGQRILLSDTPAAAAPSAPRIESLSAADLSRRVAWRDQRLEFGPTPLREIIQEFNRYSERPLVLVDPALQELSVGGSFRAGDDETLVRLLETSFGIQAERGEREIRLRRGNPPPTP